MPEPVGETKATIKNGDKRTSFRVYDDLVISIIIPDVKQTDVVSIEKAINLIFKNGKGVRFKKYLTEKKEYVVDINILRNVRRK